MKRIFTSFLVLVLCSVASWAQTETKGLSLNGVDQYMSIPNDAAFFPTKGGDYTVTATIRLSEFMSDRDARFIANRTYTGSTTDQTTTGYEIWGGKAIDQFVSCNSSLTGSPWGHSNYWTTAYGALGRYVHVAWVLEGQQKTSKIYVDGMVSDEYYDRGLSANFAISEWGNHGHDILVGAGYKAQKDEGGAVVGEALVDYFAKADIDNVHFYSRALSESEVIDDMTAFDPMTAKKLVAAYDFENIIGNTVPDVSNNGHDGQLHGFAAPEPAMCAVTIAPNHDEGRMGVYYNDMILFGGDEVPAGSEVMLQAWPNEGYELDYFTANGERIDGSTYVVNEPVLFDIVFKMVGGSTEEPAYAIPEGDRNLRQTVDDFGQVNSRAGERLLYDLTVNGATYLDNPIIFNSHINEMGGSQPEVYVDKTSEILDITGGDHISIEMSHNISWMHGYLYIDYNHDGVFNEDNELVSYSFFSADDTSDGVNSLGESVQHDCGVQLPAFTVDPNAKEIETRMRLKIDWNSKNPVGSESQSIGANAGTIIDYTLYIHKGDAAKHAVTYESLCEGGSFQVMNGDEVVYSGSEVAEGTQLTIVPTPLLGYFFSGYILNPGTETEQTFAGPFEGPVTFTVEGPTEILGFFDVQQYTVAIEKPANGSLKVTSSALGELQNGSTVVYGDELTLEAVADAGYEFDSYLVNGVVQSDNKVVVEDNITLSASFKKLEAEPEYAGPSESDNIRNSTDTRILNTVSIYGATLDGVEQEYTSTINDDNYQEEVYVDKTAEVFDMTAGDIVKVELNHNIIWMHSYLYIDYNHDGVFNEDNELVSYSYLNGQNSAGQSLSDGPATLDLPEFTVAALDKDVKTRMRLKIDWDSSNPLGNPSQSIGANSGTMVDFTVNLHAKGGDVPTDDCVVTFNDQVEGGFFMVYETESFRTLQSGDTVKPGTELTVDAAALEGFYVRNVLVNGEPANKVNGVWRFVVNEAVNVQVVFATKFLVNFNKAPEFGTVEVYAANGPVEPVAIESGAEVELGSTITVQLIPEYGYEIESFYVNGEDQKSNLVSNDMNNLTHKTWKQRGVEYDLNIEVKYRQQAAPHAINIEISEGGDIYVEDDKGNFVFNGDLVAHESTVKFTLMPKTNYELASFTINGDEKMADVVKGEGGSYSYSTVVLEDLNVAVLYMLPEGIEDATALAEVVYNGAAQTLNIPAGAHAAVYNAAGQLVKSAAGEAVVSTADLSTGAYVVRVANAGAVKVIKFIKK